jgi:hypothetical protein
MNMLVGVNMSRIFADKETERGQLAIYYWLRAPPSLLVSRLPRLWVDD